jgi:NAD(P)-dependent dehydrogenase (short-subunit alcohol dehydrogenase family)
MALEADPKKFELPEALTEGIRGKRVFITGAGKDGSMGQAFALAAGLNGAESVGVHFHSSWKDGLETVDLLREKGVNAFPVQADVTNPRDVWAMRSHVIRKMGGKPPNLVICNSGLSESGYVFGRVPKEIEDEPKEKRRARVRQAFVNNLTESEAVVDTKVNGFLSVTHLWASEAIFAKEPITLVYISSRQAVDPGLGVPGYVAANFAVLGLPATLRVNLGRNYENITPLSVCYPFVRTGMTDALAENPKVWGRWQPRMLHPEEAAAALMQLLARPAEEIKEKTFQLDVEPDASAGEGAVRISWSRIALEPSIEPLGWSQEAPLTYPGT